MFYQKVKHIGLIMIYWHVFLPCVLPYVWSSCIRHLPHLAGVEHRRTDFLKKIFSSEARKIARRREKRREKRERRVRHLFASSLQRPHPWNWMACSQYYMSHQTLSYKDSSFNEESFSSRVWFSMSHWLCLIQSQSRVMVSWTLVYDWMVHSQYDMLSQTLLANNFLLC